MEEVSVSVVMPAYNSAKYIERTILSLQEQTHKSWELIVVDDCSSDRTSELVDRVAEDDHRIRLIRLERNFGGPAGPRNVGVGEAKYDFIAFLDSDDVWHPQKLQKQMELIEPRTDFFSCSSLIDFGDDSSIEFTEIGRVSIKNINFMSQSLRSQIPTSSVILSKNLARKFPFKESSEYKAVEDYHCWLRILDSGITCRKIREPLLFYRKSEGQISGSKFKMMRKVFMVHSNYPGRRFLTSVLFTVFHVLGGVYFRFLRKGM